MARPAPTDTYKQRAAEILAPEKYGIEQQYAKNVMENLGGTATGPIVGGIAAAPRAGVGLGPPSPAEGLAGLAGGTAAVGSALSPLPGAIVAGRRLGKAQKSIEETLPKIDAAKAKNAKLQAARKPKGRPV